MPLFVCSKSECRTVDNTALSPASWMHMTTDDGQPLCTACATGAWHGSFKRATYDPAAPIGSLANPEHVWVDGQWLNEQPKRVGGWRTVDGKNQFVMDDGHPTNRPGRWMENGQWVWDDEA